RADPALGCRIINVMFRVETAEHLLSRYGPDVAGRFYGARGFLPETHLLRGPRMERAVNVAQELQTSRRTLARIEEFLLTLTNRVIEPIEAVAEGAPRWLVNACAAAQNPAVFREGAAGFIRAAGRSHEHVCRKTREVLGLTPSAYVNRVRIEHAANLLAGSEDSIARIAQDCGIENLSHFYRLFRDQYGTTPMAFRREHQRDPF
ncbi:MAG: helix-turn-helix transcriptional regulator, partial [Pseudomonadota bacterium]